MCLTASFREVEYSGVDLCRDYCVDDFRVVVRLFGLLSYLLDNIFQGVELFLDLSFGLLYTEALPVDHNEFGP